MNKGFTGRCHTEEYKQRMRDLRLSGKTGKPLKTEQEKKEINRRRNTLWRRRERATLKGKLTNRLKVALRNCINGRRTWNILPFTKEEFLSHIEGELQRYNYLCPLCHASIRDHFDIDHRIPLSSAGDNEGELLKLFCLSNLSVLCPSCNQHKKKAQYVLY